jgi:hypothetical protein
MRFPWSHVLKSVFVDALVGFALVGVILHFLR